MSKPLTYETTMNEAAQDLFEEMLEMLEVLKAQIVETNLGPIILDLGLKAPGGYMAGEYVIQVCLGGQAEVSLGMKTYSNDLSLPTVTVLSDFPAIASMGSQFAGWSIDVAGYKAMASGPIRIFSKKPKHIFELLDIKEEFDQTVIVLETSNYPTDAVLRYISERCRKSLQNISIIITPTTSIAGTTQIAGRSIETAIHKLMDLGMDITKIISGSGTCPIAPLAKKDNDLMIGRTNDMLIYGSDVYLQVDYKNEKELLGYLEKAISSTSPSYGKLFYDIVKEAKGDFYNIDKSLFAPAKLTVNNIETGKTYSYGRINSDMLIKSIK
ncbi:MAG: methenyltetrahydromethanopterin cyclohydrolase [Candidatus Heimdallarchaeota archaeon]|nr:methenyltetrahydromethanopterin cyclohydrolase [Candidatus Heimdallarchaeota archaeon]